VIQRVNFIQKFVQCVHNISNLYVVSIGLYLMHRKYDPVEFLAVKTTFFTLGVVYFLQVCILFSFSVNRNFFLTNVKLTCT